MGGTVKRNAATVLVASLWLGTCVGCALIPLVGAFRCENAYTGQMWEGNEAVRLPFHQDATTPAGIAVDTGGHKVDLQQIDWDVEDAGRCLGVTVRHCGLRVLVSDKLPPGMAGALQSPGTMVVRPSLWALRHEALHMLSGDPTHRPHARCGL